MRTRNLRVKVQLGFRSYPSSLGSNAAFLQVFFIFLPLQTQTLSIPPNTDHKW